MPLVATHADALRLEAASVEIKHLHPVGTLPGVVILAAAGINEPGLGRLGSTGDGTLLRWRAPGSEYFGESVSVTADGEYLLEDGNDTDAWVRVAAYLDELSAGPFEAVVHLADVFNNDVAADDVSAAEAAAGDVETYTITMSNDSPMDLLDVRAWTTMFPVGRYIQISQNGSDWYSPNAQGHPNVLIWGRIAAGQSETLHVRRVVEAGFEADPDILSLLHFAWDGW